MIVISAARTEMPARLKTVSGSKKNMNCAYSTPTTAVMAPEITATVNFARVVSTPSEAAASGWFLSARRRRPSAPLRMRSNTRQVMMRATSSRK